MLTHWVVFYFIFINACKPRAEAAKLSLVFPTEWALWENLAYVWNYNNHVFLRSFLNSCIITVSTMLVLILVASMAAFVLQRRGGRLTAASDKIILAGLTTPLSVIPTYWVLTKLHVANTIPGLVLVEIALLFPFSTMLYKSYASSLPKEIDEAAIVDGCGPLRTFFLVVLPMMKPTFISVGVLEIMWVWNDFLLPYLVLDRTKYMTIPIVIQHLKGSYGQVDMGATMALILLSILPVIVFYLLCQKHIIKGVAAGAVKG